ncbi:MAG TPA: amino acid permease [Polyangia bacterium]|nr:amino acid permease [Polyangia bacterium]
MEPARPLTLLPATALVVASMVGTGVFTTTGFMLADLHSPLLALSIWVVAGLLALAGAAVYAELGVMMPRVGGEYVYLSRAFHPAVGFLSGWISLLVGFAAPTAAASLAFGRYLQTLVPAVPVKAAALVLVAATTLLHLRDVRRGGATQAVLTGLVLALIVAFIVAAVASGRAEWGRLVGAGFDGGVGGAAARPGVGPVAVSLVYVAYSYFGWNAAAYVAGEIRDPDRTLPRALVGGTVTVTVLYVALNAVFMAAAPVSALAGKVEIAHVAASALLGARGGVIISALVALALAGSVSALAMTGPRVVQAMAEDGQFFRVLGRTGPRGAPTAAVLLQGTLAAVGIVTAAFEPLLIYAGFTLTLSAAATVAGAFVLRRREPTTSRPHRALGWPVSGLAYLALAAFMTLFAVRERPIESLAGLATLLTGALAWLLWQRRKRP